MILRVLNVPQTFSSLEFYEEFTAKSGGLG